MDNIYRQSKIKLEKIFKFKICPVPLLDVLHLNYFSNGRFRVFSSSRLCISVYKSKLIIKNIQHNI